MTTNRNFAADRDNRATVIAGSSGQRYIHNVFVNPDNDYELISLNWTGYNFDHSLFFGVGAHQKHRKKLTVFLCLYFFHSFIRLFFFARFLLVAVAFFSPLPWQLAEFFSHLDLSLLSASRIYRGGGCDTTAMPRGKLGNLHFYPSLSLSLSLIHSIHHSL